MPLKIPSFPAMPKLDDGNLFQLAWVVFAAKVVILLILALNTRIVMDEFWQFGQSKYLDGAFYQTIWPVKSIGYAIVYWPAHALGWDAQSTLLLGRLEAAGLVLLTLATLFCIARALGQTRLQGLIVLIILLSFSTYIERSFRLRSETPAILFSAVALLAVVRPRGMPSTRSLLIAGILCGLSFLCTQKAVYFNFALGLGICIAMLRDASWFVALRAGGVLVLGWAMAILSYAVAFGGTDAISVLRQLAFGPVNLALNGGNYYHGLDVFVRQTVLRNLPLYGVCFWGLGSAIWGWRHLRTGSLTAAIFTLVATTLVFTHNQPWPYIFAMILPFLSLWAPTIWAQVGSGPRWRTLGIIAVAVLLGSFLRNGVYFGHDNRAQFEVIRAAEMLLPLEGTYFDGIGMLPNHLDKPRRWLDRPGIAKVVAGQDDLVSAIQADPPDVVIESIRTDNLPQDFADWVGARYVAAVPGVLVPGAVMVPGETVSLKLERPGLFGVYDDDTHSTININGLWGKLPVPLTPGLHLIAWPDGAGSARLMPEGLLVPDRPRSRQSLFHGVYSK